MSDTPRTTGVRRATNSLLIITAALSVIGALYVAFFLVDDSLVDGENSNTVSTFVNPLADASGEPSQYTAPVYPATYGPDGGKRTLVLYDDSANESEVYAILAANLATHFGSVTLQKLSDYQPGQILAFDALIYQGNDYNQIIPETLVADIRSGYGKVLWAGANIEQLAGPEQSFEAEDFIATYGWSPAITMQNSLNNIAAISYHGQTLERGPGSGTVYVPEVFYPDLVEVLGYAECDAEVNPSEIIPTGRPGTCLTEFGEKYPWAVRSNNLTYVGDLSLSWQDTATPALAFADLYYDLLAPDTAATRHAAVRLEDVNPLSDPDDLVRVTDFLSERNIPFQVAVFPFHVSRVDGTEDRYAGVGLTDKPRIVEALKYMQEHGGTLIHHGTTHQFGVLDNPYPGARAGADYEFIRSQCSTNRDWPYNITPCEDDSWVQLIGPLSDDSIEQHAHRVELGRQEFIDAGLGAPEIFEVPHYGATPNAYEGIGQFYDQRYDQTMYYPGLVSGINPSFEAFINQVAPFSFTDVYGTQIVPENLGNPSITTINNHPARSVDSIVAAAEKNLAVRESTASFFFHPYLDLSILEDVVDGIEGLGYTFVPASDL